ncbi:MAG: ATP-dependent DNA helicase [Clostridia bacterium]|nr:ATP-dependent DNA helicase [Clostridia bacterium]
MTLYDGGVRISVAELVAISRRRLAPISSHGGVRRPRPDEREDGGKTRELTCEIPSPIGALTLFGAPDKISGDELTRTVALADGASAPDAELKKQTRGELFILGYMLAKETGADKIRLTAVYLVAGGKEAVSEGEEVSLSLLQKFYGSCLSALERYGAPELDRVSRRMSTLASVKFPYKEVRDGQSELVRQVYRSIARGGELFVSAPTGTGKTVSVIYPAIRALGDGRCERVFYLTPKTTTARAAAECLSLLAGYGADTRAVIISAKERICERGAVCKTDPDACKRSRQGKLSDAALALSALGKTVIGESDIRSAAEQFNVCPYELSLTYSELCEFIICDVNYVFDPGVYLRRFFDLGGKYALLVDEAHNLVNRAREMYSSELSTDELSALSDTGEPLGITRDFREALAACRDGLYSLLHPYLRENLRLGDDGRELAAQHLSEIPYEMYGIVDNLFALTEDELMRSIRSGGEKKSARVALIKEFHRKISKLRTVIQLYDEGFKLLLFLEGGSLRIKLLCIDTGKVLREKLRRVFATVFFSATLEPEDYYRDALGGRRDSDRISVKSPFDPSSLSVTIMDKISTRRQERERTLGAVCRVIAATLSARRGHYMVYAPSFEYAEMLHRAFSAKYPKIKAILQTPDMTRSERSAYLRCFDEARESYLIGFSVMGGIYSEGIDLAGDSLIGAIVVGIGMPRISYEGEAIAEYYEDKLEAGRQYAYVYPGMNKVFQAAGRVIRREDDRGVIVLIDDRFDDPIYKKSIPGLWRGMRYCSDPKELRVILDSFWRRVDGEK